MVNFVDKIFGAESILRIPHINEHYSHVVRSFRSDNGGGANTFQSSKLVNSLHPFHDLFTSEDVLWAPVVHVSEVVKALHNEMGNRLRGDRIIASLCRGFLLEYLEKAILETVKLWLCRGHVEVEVDNALEESSSLDPHNWGYLNKMRIHLVYNATHVGEVLCLNQMGEWELCGLPIESV
jgi:hypothetical protein